MPPAEDIFERISLFDEADVPLHANGLYFE